MGRQVICYIQAFDCERTIEAAMQSVLDQTYGDWLCFVLSNGNRNTVEAPNWTFDVIKNFAAKDSRFIVLNKRDNVLFRYIPMLYHLAHSFPDSYICSLDADDVYQSDFFERAVALAKEERLDIVACGTEIVLKRDAEAAEETLLSQRAIKEDLVVQREDFTQKFIVYKPFFNEMWGKLYRTDLFGPQHDEAYARKNFWWHFLPDTLFTIDTLSRSTAIGILSGTSHRFYQFQKRNTTNATILVNERFANRHTLRRNASASRFSVYTTYETVMAFLRAHGGIDDALYEYMQAVLFGWFGDFYARTLLLTTDATDLAGHTERLVFNPKFDELISYMDSGKYDNLRGYRQRSEFCRRLRHMMVGQTVLRDRMFLRCRNLPRVSSTRRKIERIVSKLDAAIQMLEGLQKEGYPC